ncbi:hypothetical protein J0383_12980 [Flavobacterium endoglycinae]|uniref:Uncharacterized protein n=2 Tax=Flavobacterium endoglycinae TaxID=2816357 RepID=A0ABX7Q9B4_9FLAO|nr:hypothetical protein [Flavobacterium endoglycinae]QSW87211.1 hypothetical protein J0383_12980 [Flavobacterium endoglycinae]
MVVEISKLKERKPLITLSNEGISFSGSYFSELGIVKWEDITSCFDANYGGYTESSLFILVSDNETYINKINNSAKRDQFRKLIKTHRGALLWSEVRILDCNIIELKQTIFQNIKKQ